MMTTTTTQHKDNDKNRYDNITTFHCWWQPRVLMLCQNESFEQMQVITRRGHVAYHKCPIGLVVLPLRFGDGKSI
jgi:hypothetical protein